MTVREYLDLTEFYTDCNKMSISLTKCKAVKSASAPMPHMEYQPILTVSKWKLSQTHWLLDCFVLNDSYPPIELLSDMGKKKEEFEAGRLVHLIVSNQQELEKLYTTFQLKNMIEYIDKILISKMANVGVPKTIYCRKAELGEIADILEKEEEEEKTRTKSFLSLLREGRSL